MTLTLKDRCSSCYHKEFWHDEKGWCGICSSICQSKVESMPKKNLKVNMKREATVKVCSN